MSDRRRPDHWSRRAKDEGFAARSVYKLEQIDVRERILAGVHRVIDLGCCPGSWSQYVRQRGIPHLVGVDLTPTPGYPGTFLQGSILEVSPPALLAALGGAADLVLSDMAPLTSGHRFTDHVRQLALAEAALEIARGTLRPGGDFVVKVFDGGDAPAFVDAVRAQFSSVKRIKPKTTRSESVEFFVVGRGFTGPSA